MHFADALDQQFGRGLFEHDPGGPELHRLDELVLIVGSGQHDDAGLVLGDLKPLQGGQAIQPGHFQVEQQDVGFVLLKNVEYLAPVLRLRHDFEVFFEREQPAKPVAEDGMVVRYHDADLGLHGCSHAGGGPIDTRTVLSHTLSVRYVEF